MIKASEGSSSEKSAFFCFIDADDFKQINETYGHNIGDQILIKLASLMNKLTKSESDFSARIGGDEFAMILVFPKNKRKIMIQRIRDIHQEITKNLHVSTANGKRVSLQISIGVAEITTESANLEEVKDRADQLLYDAKDEGKNIVIFENQTPTQERSILKKIKNLLKKYFPNFL